MTYTLHSLTQNGIGRGAKYMKWMLKFHKKMIKLNTSKFRKYETGRSENENIVMI
jgi:hypothetical protein